MIAVVVPTVGRPSLDLLLAALAEDPPERLVLVDDRPGRDHDGVAGRIPAALRPVTVVTRAGGHGPAAARNAGWRACPADWICCLDDDVVPTPGWTAALRRDVEGASADVVAIQGRLTVPLPGDRRPTDFERDVAGLATARWITADMALRRDALAAAGGFDERFPRAYREDADVALRLVAAGGRIVRGTRRVLHPVPPAPWHVSVGRQRGNADDALMDALHGTGAGGWRERAGAPAGALDGHRRTVACSLGAVGAAALGHRSGAALLAAAWAARTAAFAWRRIAPGPRTQREVAAMAATSAVLPAAAVAHRVRGEWRAGRLVRAVPGPGELRPPGPPRAVLFDRDATLVQDVPYNGDPARVQLMPHARETLDRLRAEGVALGVVSNQSGVARGRITPAQVEAVNARAEALLGPIGTWAWCPHGPEDGCDCRKPQPGLVHRAAAALGVAPGDCVVVGDIGADVEAAAAAGARGILVPTPITRAEEVAAAPEVAPDLAAVADLLLGTPQPVALRAVA